MKLQLTITLTAMSLCLLAQEKGLSPFPIDRTTGSDATYAVVVGTSDYQDPGFPNIRFTDGHETAFVDFLRKSAGFCTGSRFYSCDSEVKIKRGNEHSDLISSPGLIPYTR